MVNVFLVEDNPGDVLLLTEALERSGAQTGLAVARTVEDALQSIACWHEETPPDLLILDLNLGGASGLDVLREVRRRPALKALEVVVLSSSDASDDIDRARRCGATDYRQKPRVIHDWFALGRDLVALSTARTERAPTDGR